MTRTFEKKQPLFEEVISYFNINSDLIAVQSRQDEPPIVFYTNDVRKEGAEAQLEELFEALELHRIQRSSTLAPGGFFLRYDFEMRGLGPSSLEKGFAYLPKPPQAEDIVDSLDDLPSNLPLYPLYKPLQGNWYLYIYYVD